MDEDLEEEEGNRPALIIDTGNGFTKAGFANEKQPRHIIPTIVGRPRFDGPRVGFMFKDIYYGSEVTKRMHILNTVSPMQHGIVTNWRDMESLWHHILSHDMCTSDNHTVLLTESAMNPSTHRRRTCQIWFESFNVPSLFIECTICYLILLVN